MEEPQGAVNLDEIDFDELDDYLELFQQDGVIKQALDKGVDLRQYARQIDHELRAAEVDSVSQYVMKSTDIVELHDQVQECDNILAKMQEMLLGFQVGCRSRRFSQCESKCWYLSCSCYLMDQTRRILAASATRSVSCKTNRSA